MNSPTINYWRCINCDKYKRMPCLFITTSEENQFISCSKCSKGNLPEWIKITYNEAMTHISQAHKNLGYTSNEKPVGRFDDLEIVSEND